MDKNVILSLTEEIARVVGSNMAKIANEIGTVEGMIEGLNTALAIAGEVDKFLAVMGIDDSAPATDDTAPAPAANDTDAAQ